MKRTPIDGTNPKIDRVITNRLLLIPFTTRMCEEILNDDFSSLTEIGLKRGASWPDADVVETLPKIIKNLSFTNSPTGFESWMIIKRETLEIIGDLGFKGFNAEGENIDLGYGIIKEERRNGYAEEAARALIRWAFSTEMVMEITARCLTHNYCSINLLKKLGFVETGNDGAMAYWTLPKRTHKDPIAG